MSKLESGVVVSNNPTRPPIADMAPSADHVTAYDRAHTGTYLRLLDAAETKAAWKDAARTMLEIDPEKQPESARRRYDTHLARARWLITQGYRDLLRGDRS